MNDTQPTYRLRNEAMPYRVRHQSFAWRLIYLRVILDLFLAICRACNPAHQGTAFNNHFTELPSPMRADFYTKGEGASKGVLIGAFYGRLNPAQYLNFQIW
jgi:hypothetical protein